MKFTEKYSRLFQLLLPTPLSIALALTFVTIAIAYLYTAPSTSGINYVYTLLEYWEKGLWNSGLMVFAMQMMLMLVLGHILAMSPVIDTLIVKLTSFATNNSRAAALVCFSTIIVALFNWGLGLIFGANIGTTATAWLVAGFGLKIKISALALPVLIFGLIFFP